MKQILIFKHKHGNQYYDASTNELLAKACLHILEFRLEEGWYVPEKPEIEDVLSEEEIEKLPERLQKTERDRLKRTEKAKKEYEVELKYFDELKKVVETKDISLIRRGGWHIPYTFYLIQKYEDVDLEELTHVE